MNVPNRKGYHLFPSLTALLHHVESLPQRGTTDTWHDQWAGGTLADAKRLIERGWPEAATKAAKLAERVAERTLGDPARATVEELVYDVSGGAFDPGAIASGVPESWVRIAGTEAKREVRIVLNCTASAVVSAETLLNRGLAVAALVLVLQARGYVVSVDVGEHGLDRLTDRLRVWYVRVHDGASGSPLDIDRLVYALAHPTMLRVLFSSAVNGWRGSNTDGLWAREKVTDAGAPADATIFIGAADGADRSRWADGGEAWVLAEYERQTQEA